MTDGDDDRFLSRREAEILIAHAVDAQKERAESHAREHKQESEAIDKALGAEAKQQSEHNLAHEKAHDSHEDKHKAEGEAVKTALAAVGSERKIHAEAHIKEHEGHQREHGLNNLAIDKAEAASDRRFASVNGTRAQMDDMLRSMASQDAFNALVTEFDRYREDSRKDLDRRLTEQQTLIAGVREADIKAEGKGLGQTATIAAVGFIVGLVVALSNVLTGV